MKFATALLVLCAFAAGAESKAVSISRTGQQRNERNLLTDAVSGVQHAVGQAVGGVLNAGGALVHNAIGAAEGAVVGAVNVAEKLAEQLVHHNVFAVSILQCLAGAATRKTQDVADNAEGMVDAVANTVAGTLHLDASETAAGDKAARNLLVEAGGAVRDCVVDALHQSVTDLQQVAHVVVGNTSSVAHEALEALKQAIENNVQGNSTLLQSLDDAVNVAEQVVKNITQTADDVVDDVADKADDALDNFSNGNNGDSRRRHIARNVLNDFVDQMKNSFAKNMANLINSTAESAEQKAHQMIAQFEEAANKSIQDAQTTIDANLVEGSDWKQILETLLQNATNTKNQLASNAEGVVESLGEKAEELAAAVSTKA